MFIDRTDSVLDNAVYRWGLEQEFYDWLDEEGLTDEKGNIDHIRLEKMREQEEDDNYYLMEAGDV